MAIITNCPLGDISGSIGPNTFYKIGAKQIVRRRVQPSNPNTICQVGARSSLKSVAARWQDLPLITKNAFFDWGLNSFISPKTNQPPPHNGYQTWIGLKNLSKQNYDNINPTQGWTNISSAWESFVGISNKVDWTVPGNYITPYILNSVGDPILFDSMTLGISSTPELTLDLLLPNGENYANDSVLYSKEGLLYNFSFYLSNCLRSDGEKPKQYYRKHLGCTGNVSLPGTSLNGFHLLNIKMDLSLAVNRCRFTLRPLQWYYCTVVVTTPNGTGYWYFAQYINIT